MKMKVTESEEAAEDRMSIAYYIAGRTGLGMGNGARDINEIFASRQSPDLEDQGQRLQHPPQLLNIQTIVC